MSVGVAGMITTSRPLCKSAGSTPWVLAVGPFLCPPVPKAGSSAGFLTVWSGLQTGPEPQGEPSSPITTGGPQIAGGPGLLHPRLASPAPHHLHPPSCIPGRCGLVSVTAQRCLVLDQGRQVKTFHNQPQRPHQFTSQLS